jgi:hypothetical protein
MDPVRSRTNSICCLAGTAAGLAGSSNNISKRRHRAVEREGEVRRVAIRVGKGRVWVDPKPLFVAAAVGGTTQSPCNMARFVQEFLQVGPNMIQSLLLRHQLARRL